ncbi:YHS domain-containing protein [Haladaptatus sp. NG-WS-4]
MGENDVVDPVCGMSIEKSTAATKTEYEGQTYYFCSEDCKQKFDSKPESYN